MAVLAQTLTITRSSLSLADLVITNSVPGPSTDFSIPEGGLAFPDFDVRIAYHPDADDVSGSVLQSYALGVGSCPLTLEVHGTTIADLQVNRRALEAAFYQPEGEFLTIGLGTEEETYPMFPSWPKWGAVNSGALVSRIATATLAVPVNPLVVA